MKQTRHIRRIAEAGMLVLVLLPSIAAAQEGPGCTGADYLTHAVGCKSIAMGEVKSALTGDPFNWLATPGAFHDVNGNGAGLFHAEWIVDTRYNNLFYSNRLNEKFAFAGGLTYTYRPDIQGYDRDGPTGMLKSYNYQAVAGFGFSPVEEFTAGVNFKYFSEKLDTWTEGGVCFDLGAKYVFEECGISMGFAAQNVGPDIKSETLSEPLPMTIRFGAAHSVSLVEEEVAVSYAFDLVKPRFEDLYLSVGCELELYNMLMIRGGYVGQESRAGDGLTMGGGIRIDERLLLDYAWTPYGDLGNLHRISIFFSIN